MKVLYDYQVFNLQKFGGVSRYFIELISSLEKNKEFKWELPIYWSDNDYLHNFSASATRWVQSPRPYNHFLYGLDFKGKRTLSAFFNKRRSIKSLAAGKYSLFHPTYYDDYFLPYIGSKPFVITVHDMIHELYPQYFPNNLIAARKRALVEKASKIITISTNTKKDLVNRLNVPEEKIEVIYLGSSLHTTTTKSNVTHFKLPDKYLLYVGRRDTYKNFTAFIRSVGDLLLKDKDLHIICTGSSFTTQEQQLFRHLNIKNKILYYPSTDDMLAYLYIHALAFVFPSLYEGFGIPVLEAFNCGCPCIISNASSLPEVGGNAAVYFDPKIEQTIQTAVTNVIYNEKLRQNLIQLGYQQAKKFSWEVMASKIYALYQGIL